MVICNTTQQKPLMSSEAPLLHHARAKAVVDMREDKTKYSSPQEIHLTVEQLLRDSRKSLHIASRSQVLTSVRGDYILTSSQFPLSS